MSITTMMRRNLSLVKVLMLVSYVIKNAEKIKMISRVETSCSTNNAHLCVRAAVTPGPSRREQALS